MPVTIVTDSTAMLPAAVVADRGIEVVPLQVVIGPDVHDDGSPEASPEAVAAALGTSVPVSTSRPAPAVFAELYARLAAAGTTEVLAVHLSGAMSGTFESAEIAARTSPVPVTTVDTRQVGPALGYAVLSAADALATGATAAEAAEAARRRAAATTSLFYVDTLEHLRRGGRIGAAAALFGTALAVKPLLGFDDGRVVPRERVRTASRALARLEELAVEAAAEDRGAVEVCVAHLANPDVAARLAEHLAERIGDRLAPPWDDPAAAPGVACGELGPVLGAHVGPGVVAVCVAPRR